MMASVLSECDENEREIMRCFCVLMSFRLSFLSIYNVKNLVGNSLKYICTTTIKVNKKRG